jgi:hypothetical protein
MGDKFSDQIEKHRFSLLVEDLDYLFGSYLRDIVDKITSQEVKELYEEIHDLEQDTIRLKEEKKELTNRVGVLEDENEELAKTVADLLKRDLAVENKELYYKIEKLLAMLQDFKRLSQNIE